MARGSRGALGVHGRIDRSEIDDVSFAKLLPVHGRIDRSESRGNGSGWV